MNRDIVEVLREGATAYAEEVGGGHASRYTRAAEEIERLRTVLNRIANGTRLPSDDVQKVMHKVTTEALGEHYKPFPVQF